MSKKQFIIEEIESRQQSADPVAIILGLMLVGYLLTQVGSFIVQKLPL